MNPAIVVDVGNTRVKWGRCDAQRVLDMVSLPHADESAWSRQLDAWKVPAGAPWALGGVHPRERDHLNDWLRSQGQQTLVLEARRQVPLAVDVDVPDKVGLDRLLNAVAVNTARSPLAAAAIIDAGTAVTVDYVDQGGVFRGGAILPGLRLMAAALHQYTALLPAVEDFELTAMPAKNTEDALRTGIVNAVVGGVERLLQRLLREARGPCEIYFGGGDADVVAARLTVPVRVWPEMTLEGIRQSAALL